MTAKVTPTRKRKLSSPSAACRAPSASQAVQLCNNALLMLFAFDALALWHFRLDWTKRILSRGSWMQLHSGWQLRYTYLAQETLSNSSPCYINPLSVELPRLIPGIEQPDGAVQSKAVISLSINITAGPACCITTDMPATNSTATPCKKPSPAEGDRQCHAGRGQPAQSLV